MPDFELGKILNFDQSDLNANRGGKLTSRQNKALDRSDKLDSLISTSLAILFILIALYFTYRQFSSMLAQGFSFTNPSITNLSTENKTGLLILGIVWLTMGLVAVGSFIRSFNKVNRTVRKAEGKTSFAKVEKRIEKLDTDGHMSFVRNEVQYDLHVGTNIFSGVNENLMNIMRDGDFYAVYYVDGFGILSGELVNKGK